MNSPKVIIVGSGIAGLSLALKLDAKHPGISILIITKAEAMESNTRYAQGGIAAVLNTNTDSIQSHIDDTIASGGELCNREIVEMVVNNAADEIAWLRKMGVVFDQNENGELNMALEGGHHHPRVVHAKDQTGLSVAETLLKRVLESSNIEIKTNLLVADLIKENNSIVGLHIYNESENKYESLYSNFIILSTGGCGQLFENTTNPSVATGDGYAMAIRAGALLQNMQYIQFHPTALYQKKISQSAFLISEAVRGFGAHVVDNKGVRFLFSEDIRGELATRDIVSDAINKYKTKHHLNCVYLDIRHIDYTKFRNHFPTITDKLEEQGFDIRKDLIPIIPSAHYQCGGIVSNKYGESSLENLYAIGEVACTGLHGKNRLASNSLLEALVFSENASKDIVSKINTTKQDIETNKTELAKQCIKANFEWLSTKIQNIKKWMSLCYSLHDKETIEAAIRYMQLVKNLTKSLLQNNFFSAELLQLHNMAYVAEHILLQLKYTDNNIALSSENTLDYVI